MHVCVTMGLEWPEEMAVCLPDHLEENEAIRFRDQAKVAVIRDSFQCSRTPVRDCRHLTAIAASAAAALQCFPT